MKITSISFLYGEERIILKSSRSGLFRVPVRPNSRYSKKEGVTYKNMTAREVIEISLVRDGDPVLTFVNGEKFRVFQGGDSSYMLSESDGLIKKHDDFFKKSRQNSDFTSWFDENSWYDGDW